MIGVGIIGSGQIALANHLPGFALCPDTKVVALCDSNPAVLEKASQQSGIKATYTGYQQLIARDDVNAVLIATPNFLHAPIALAAIAAGKHVMCEKPIAMNLPEAMEMLRAAEKANVRHMTAFTYRFVPAMQYMAHLVVRGDVGRPFHF
ncbi:MAG TPA: Gfo/Idh/MocA family oxidoreductase, partial [Tepidisphaeraceae bacterium]|nr:Gfo/Idh/MocA family oxidoreductase [Tepidisphaeraceae bacterium]